jgi:hypothetical protein
MSDIAVAESGTRLQNFLDRAGLRGFPWKTATILYTISWGWLFIVRDSYWSDDWDDFKFPPLAKVDYEEFGYAPWKAPIFLLFDHMGPSVFRYLTFCLFFCAGVFLFGIVKQAPFFTAFEKKLIVCFFLVLPFNTVRLALNVFYYTEAYFLFFAAWYVLVVFNSRISRFVSAILFFLSFLMFTNLVFFLLPVAHQFLLSGGRKLRSSLSWLKQNLLLISLPFIYWVLRSNFWSSEREYHSVTQSKVNGFLRFVFLIFLILMVLSFAYRLAQQSYKVNVSVLILGVGTIFVGYAPYVFFGLVGYGFDVPVTYLVILLGRSDWVSRHQILQPLGLSILIGGLIGLLSTFTKRLRNPIIGLILAISVLFNIAFGFEYVVDYSKQMAVVNAFVVKQSKTAGDEIQIVDQTTFLNARQRSYRERDWLGLVGLAEGIESAKKLSVVGGCSENPNSRLVLIQGPETHWEALKNWVSDRDMGFKVTIDDTPGACKPEMVTNQRSSGAIPILFYFTGAKG